MNENNFNDFSTCDFFTDYIWLLLFWERFYANINYLKLRSADCRENPTVTVGTTAGFLAVTVVVYSLSDILTDSVVCVKLLSSLKN